MEYSGKYTVQIVTIIDDREVCCSKPVALIVKMGSATLTLNADSTTLFAKLADQFEIFDYGNGRYAIGFKDSEIPAKITGVNLPLEVWLDGNGTAKANASVNVKISIIP